MTQGAVKRPVRMIGIYLALVVALGVLYVRMPTSFLPTEDQGVLLNLVQLPQGATMERTMDAMEKCANTMPLNPQWNRCSRLQAFSFSGQGQNVGMAFVKAQRLG